MKKMMIYPYSNAYEPYVLYSELMDNIKVTSLVASSGSGIVGKSITTDNEILVVSSDFEEELSKCDIVWFVEDEKYELSNGVVREHLMSAVENHKKIVFTRTMKKEGKQIEALIPEQQNITPKRLVETKEKLIYEHCYRIETPVLIIYGTEKDTGKLGVQLALRKEFIEKGYRVSSISSRLDSELYGVHAIPSFMFDTSNNETEKIQKYNHYVKQIELMEYPDIIIIGIPGGILPYDEIDHNEYGILAHEISYAVPCDAAIMCIPYNPDFTGDYSDLGKAVEQIFRFQTIGCNLAARVPDMQRTIENKERHLVSLDSDFIDSKIATYKRNNVFNFLNKNDANKAAEHIIDFLS